MQNYPLETREKPWQRMKKTDLSMEAQKAWPHKPYACPLLSMFQSRKGQGEKVVATVCSIYKGHR